MRIALLADIHGNLPALEAVVTDLGRRQVDQVVTLGDHPSGPLLPFETAVFLMAQPWIHIAGNHERQLVAYNATTAGPSDRHAHERLTQEQLAWLREMRPTARLAGGVFLCHGTPESDSAYLLDTVERGSVRLATPAEMDARLSGVDAVVVACGHSHVARVVRTRKGQTLINPGSVGLPAFQDDQPIPYVVETGSPDARYAVLEMRDSCCVVDLVAVPYDFAPMAELARRHGRPEWARALGTGYVRTC